MKTLLAFLFVCCFATGAVTAQEKIDVVRLKNGVTYRGTLLSSPNADTVELRDSRVSVLSFTKEEIDRISVEYPNFKADSLAKFGGVFSIGWAIGGGDLLGVPLRLRIGNTGAFETGLFFRPFIIKLYNNDVDVKGGLLVAGALNLGMKKQYKPLKRKVVSNGVFIRGGTGISKYKETVLGFGWASERFRQNNKKYSFISELGPGLVIRHWLNDPDLGFIPDKTSEVGFILAWKIHWNSYPN